MRLALILVLLLAAPAAAQAPMASPWRLAVSGGLADGVRAVTGSFAAERVVRGPVSTGVRASFYDDSRIEDDVSPPIGGAVEAYGAVGTRGRRARLRAGAGIGVSVIGFSGGGAEPACIADDAGEVVCFKTTSDLGPRPYAVASAGLDVYLTRRVGLGAEVRAVLMESYDLSSAELGLRVRL